jgi:hypothetical protein
MNAYKKKTGRACLFLCEALARIGVVSLKKQKNARAGFTPRGHWFKQWR